MSESILFIINTQEGFLQDFPENSEENYLKNMCIIMIVATPKSVFDIQIGYFTKMIFVLFQYFMAL